MPRYLVKKTGKKIDYAPLPKRLSQEDIRHVQSHKQMKGYKLVIAKNKQEMLKKVTGKTLKPKKEKNPFDFFDFR